MPSPIAPIAELPLMLADLPRGVERLLRDAGVPAAPLPAPVLPSTICGRFVLFDSSRRGSVTQAATAFSHGLTPIDLRKLAGRCDELESVAPVPHGHGWSPAAGDLLLRLKQALEIEGGLWARLSDFPFPYQSGLCLAVEYDDGSIGDLADVSAALPSTTTHFLPTRLRPELFATPMPRELGWRVAPDDCLSYARKTISHWQTRWERFRGAGDVPAGLLLTDPACRLPGTASLWELGLRYLAQPHSASPRVGACGGVGPAQGWVDAGLTWLPARERFLEWVSEHYQSGRPLFVVAGASQAGTAAELLAFSREADRCSLLWNTSLAGWASFWSERRQVRFTVRRGSTGIEIDPQCELPRHAFGVELWRGGHFATLPLRRGGLTVSDDGLPYLMASRRNPAGCSIPLADPMSGSSFQTPTETGSAVG